MKQKSFWRRKVFGFTLPDLFGYSTFSVYVFYFYAWPTEKYGTNCWLFEIAIGPPRWGLSNSIKLDFWNPKDMGGYVLDENGEMIHESQLKKKT